MLRECTRAKRTSENYEILDVGGCTRKSLKETPLNLYALKKLNEEVRDTHLKGLITRLLELCESRNRLNGRASVRT